jgi:CDP-glucose 4,6-dehydratase
VTKLKVLVTGHTGFKGSWLSLWLSMNGHELYGISLPPLKNGIYEQSNLDKIFSKSVIQDISDFSKVKDFINTVKPDLIYHLAAQPLVIDSYLNPVQTIQTNVIGSLNILESVKDSTSVKKLLMVTTDKVYKNIGKVDGYSEEEMLGGEDPYSVSKSMTDLMIQSWSKSFKLPNLAIVRAGNVIGGGDRSPNRLIPDLVHALNSKTPLTIRNPDSVRPWQHVLDCLNGYEAAMAKLSNSNIEDNIWNFGPDDNQKMTVKEVCESALTSWPSSDPTEINYVSDNKSEYKESKMLTLNAEKAHRVLGWSNKLNNQAAIDYTMEWEYNVSKGSDPFKITEEQISNFLSI